MTFLQDFVTSVFFRFCAYFRFPEILLRLVEKSRAALTLAVTLSVVVFILFLFLMINTKVYSFFPSIKMSFIYFFLFKGLFLKSGCFTDRFKIWQRPREVFSLLPALAGPLAFPSVPLYCLTLNLNLLFHKACFYVRTPTLCSQMKSVFVQGIRICLTLLSFALFRPFIFSGIFNTVMLSLSCIWNWYWRR